MQHLSLNDGLLQGGDDGNIQGLQGACGTWVCYCQHLEFAETCTGLRKFVENVIFEQSDCSVHGGSFWCDEVFMWLSRR